jgi:hypothetical protein
MAAVPAAVLASAFVMVVLSFVRSVLENPIHRAGRHEKQGE